jgi:spore maturation protein CgeB
VKVLVAHPGAHFSVSDVYDGWVEALGELGCRVAPFNLGDRLSFYAGAELNRDGEYRLAFSLEAAAHLAAKGIQGVCYEFLPDVVLVVSCFFVPPEVLDLCRARGSKVVIVHLEEPYESDRELARAAHADLNLINDPTNLDEFTAVAPTVYMPAAYRPSLHRPGPVVPDAVSDFAFVGTGFPSRVEFFEAVDWAGIDVALAGNWADLDVDSPLRKFMAHDLAACCPNEEAVSLYRSTKVSANLYRQETSEGGHAAGWAMSPREVELAATGCFYLAEERAENRQVLPMVPTFTGPADFEDKLRWWLAHEDQRDAVAVAARAAVAPRSFQNNARELLRLLGS